MGLRCAKRNELDRGSAMGFQLCSKMETREKSAKALNHDLEAKIADLESKCQTWRRLYDMTSRKETRPNVGQNVIHDPQVVNADLGRHQTVVQEKESSIQESEYGDEESEEEWSDQEHPSASNDNTKGLEDLTTGDLIAASSETGSIGQERGASSSQGIQELRAKFAELEVKY